MKEPIEINDIRKGDLIRFEYDDKESAHEYRANSDREGWSRRGKHFLLERPTPPVTLPTEPGVYASRTGDFWIKTRGSDLRWARAEIELDPRDFAPFTKLERVRVTAKRVLDRFVELDGGSDGCCPHVLSMSNQLALEFGVTDA